MKTTKKYCVKLNEDHNASEDQIIGKVFKYLKSPFGNDVAEFSRGEAIKKARMFGGRIEVSREVKYLFIQLQENNSEHSYCHKSVHEVKADVDNDTLANDYASDFYGSNSVKEDGKYHFFSSSIVIEIEKVEEIEESEFNTLKKYL